MHERVAADTSALFWSATDLTAAYRAGTLDPVDVAREVLRRVELYDDELRSYLSVTEDTLVEQAQRAAAGYAHTDDTPPLLGVPVAVKDVFHVRGAETTCGSTLFTGQVAVHDSGVPRRLRDAGAMFVGKTNTPEFCQSATTENLLGAATRNPWDPERTAGGSSGGSAAAVAAGLATAAVGSDGGGSIRIPAAFTGLVGVKPTLRLCPDEYGFRTMTEFASPGPMARTVADARLLLEVLSGRSFARVPRRGLRVVWSTRPDDAPVEPAVVAHAERAVRQLTELGHHVAAGQVPVDGWEEIFAPLVLAEEHRERGHLLRLAESGLTAYERRSLQAGRALEPTDVHAAMADLPAFRARVAEFFESVDLVVCPTVAVPAFPVGQRPRTVDGRRVRQLWGAFPFTAPFNVAGTPALTVPCGLVDGLPVGVQLVGAPGTEGLLLDVAEDLEDAIAFDRSALARRWSESLRAERV